MKHGTGIEWTHGDGFRGETWNPVTGCSKVSPGCAHCYAEAISLRFGWSKKPWKPEHAAENVVLHPERLDQPLRWRKPRMVFVNSMSDLFHELIDDRYVAEVFAVMALAGHHTFQVLTKRPERMRELLGSPFWWACVEGAAQRRIYETTGVDRSYTLAVHGPLPNVWLGVSIENARHTWRADVLREIPAAVRFISAEPLLGSLSKSAPNCSLNLDGIDWLIAGAESGPGARPMREDWVRELRDACQAAAVAFFYKQAAVNGRKVSLPLLDGRQWTEMPRR